MHFKALLTLLSMALIQPTNQECNSRCITCDTTNSCKTCIKGYTPIEGTCKKISTPFCIEINSSNKCLKCTTGYRLENLECKKCSVGGCKNCTENTKTCDECYEGYFFQDLSCKTRCTVSNCAVCKSRVTSCDLCFSGYRQNSTKNGCEKCLIPNCANCDRDTRICERCQKNYYLDGEDCVLCPFGCRNCRNNTFCQTCDDEFGYFMTSGLTCVMGSRLVGEGVVIGLILAILCFFGFGE